MSYELISPLVRMDGAPSARSSATDDSFATLALTYRSVDTPRMRPPLSDLSGASTGHLMHRLSQTLIAEHAAFLRTLDRALLERPLIFDPLVYSKVVATLDNGWQAVAGGTNYRLNALRSLDWRRIAAAWMTVEAAGTGDLDAAEVCTPLRTFSEAVEADYDLTQCLSLLLASKTRSELRVRLHGFASLVWLYLDDVAVAVEDALNSAAAPRDSTAASLSGVRLSASRARVLISACIDEDATWMSIMPSHADEVSVSTAHCLALLYGRPT